MQERKAIRIHTTKISKPGKPVQYKIKSLISESGPDEFGIRVEEWITEYIPKRNN